MIIASRSAAISHSTDPVAQSVRGFIAPAQRLESRAQAEPSAPGELDLARLYPSVFAADPAPSVTTFAARAKSAALYAAAGAAAIIIGVINHP